MSLPLKGLLSQASVPIVCKHNVIWLHWWWTTAAITTTNKTTLVKLNVLVTTKSVTWRTGKTVFVFSTNLKKKKKKKKKQKMVSLHHGSSSLWLFWLTHERLFWWHFNLLPCVSSVLWIVDVWRYVHFFSSPQALCIRLVTWSQNV